MSIEKQYISGAWLERRQRKLALVSSAAILGPGFGEAVRGALGATRFHRPPDSRRLHALVDVVHEIPEVARHTFIAFANSPEVDERLDAATAALALSALDSKLAHRLLEALAEDDNLVIRHVAVDSLSALLEREAWSAGQV